MPRFPLPGVVRFVATAVLGLLVLPIPQEFIVKLAEENGVFDQPSARVGAAMTLLSSITDASWYPWAVGFMAGLVTGLWADLLLRKIVPPKKPSMDGAKKPTSRPDTWLRLRLDQSGSGHYLQMALANVDHWQQTVHLVTGHNVDGTIREIVRVDHLAVTFLVPIDYSRPIINTFGHPMGSFNFYSLGEKGGLFHFQSTIPPMLEIVFPPPDHYEKIAANEGGVIPPQEPSELASETQR